jgi:lysophospholipase L1-like esterase
VGVATVAVLVAAILGEGAVRWIAPQPVDYYTFVSKPQPGSRHRQWNVEVAFNDYGFRDVNHDLRKPPFSTRIAFIGDSITFGTGVRFEDVYHQRLRGFLNNRDRGQRAVEVLAFNQGAASTEWARATYNRIVRRFKPDVVVLAFCLNDFLPYSSLKSKRSLRRSVYDALASVHTRLRVTSHLYFLLIERSRPLAYQYLLDRKVRTLDSWIALETKQPEFTSRFGATVEVLTHLARDVWRDGSRFVIVAFPYEMQMDSRHADLYESTYGFSDLTTAPLGEAQQLLGKALGDRGIEFLDLLPAFRAAAAASPDEPLYFREFGGLLDWIHPNRQGHEVAARAIAEYLSRPRRSE